MSCHCGSNSKSKASNGKYLTFALAGNANVGKSVIFNQLTGSNQIIGNWPGKTVDRAEGTLSFEGHANKNNRFTRHLLVLHVFDGRVGFARLCSA